MAYTEMNGGTIHGYITEVWVEPDDDGTRSVLNSIILGDYGSELAGG